MRPYRKRMPLSHFTDMVDAPTAAEMTRLVQGMSERVRKQVNLQDHDGKAIMDNFFVILAADKGRL
jgi:hypothetical protein